MMHRYRCPLKKWQTTPGLFWQNNQTLQKTPFARCISVLPSEQLDHDDKWSMTGFVHRRGDNVRPIKGTWWLCLFPCTSCPIEPGHNSENHFNYFQFNLTFTFIRNFHHHWTFTSYQLSLNFGNSLSLSSNLNVIKVIEVFLVNPNSTRHPVAHPVHLHGHLYSVLSTGNSLSSNQNFPFFTATTTLSSPGPVPAKDPLGWVQEQDLLGTIPRNLDHPPRKDSMQTAPGSYTLIRWKMRILEIRLM